MSRPRPLVSRPLDWLAGAPVVVRVERELDAPAGAVWSLVADHAGWPLWFRSIRAVEPGPVAEGVGGTRRVHLRGATLDEEFLAWEPGRCFAFTVTAAHPRPVRSLVERLDIAPRGERRCLVTYTQGVDAAPAVRPLLEVARPGVRRVLDRALGRLGDLAAAGARDDPSPAGPGE